ncbi:MAG: hypothetical protein J5880_03030 [Bacilli bacterium]|nr:hypothetical protein [Bacilli bacterium]
MNKYCLYYFPPKSDQNLGDSLIIYFGGNLQTTANQKGNGVDKLFNKETLIGYLVHDFSNYCKIRMSGPIFLPNDEIIDLLNDILINAGLNPLDYFDHSGFVVGEVMNKRELKKSYLYEIDINRQINVESTFDLKVGDKVVIALNGTYLMPGMMVNAFEIEKGVNSDGRICSNQDLLVPPNEDFFPVIVENDTDNGEDFFKVERRESDA